MDDDLKKTQEQLELEIKNKETWIELYHESQREIQSLKRKLDSLLDLEIVTWKPDVHYKRPQYENVRKYLQDRENNNNA